MDTQVFTEKPAKTDSKIDENIALLEFPLKMGFESIYISNFLAEKGGKGNLLNKSNRPDFPGKIDIYDLS